jgi:hypothetical protein
MSGFSILVLSLLFVATLASIFVEKLTFFGPLFLGCLLLGVCRAWAIRSETASSEPERDTHYKSAA